ncbi:hypothetical protein KC973_03755 [Candidatus Saccharibacteria bacterium]|nr:hypothetical protein [Candidatus Saccharibacteria bacterium]
MLRKTLDIILGKDLAQKVYGTVPTFTANQQYNRLERQLIDHEAAIGARILGPTPAGRQRQFFCMDSHTWIWHETWRDEKGKAHAQHVQYDVRHDSILKRVNGGSPRRVTGQELRNFDYAVSRYYQEVASEVYGRTVTA